MNCFDIVCALWINNQVIDPVIKWITIYFSLLFKKSFFVKLEKALKVTYIKKMILIELFSILYSYRIQQGSFDDFSINNETGLVSITRKLDYDKRDNYRIEIVASDLGKFIEIYLFHLYMEHEYMQTKCLIQHVVCVTFMHAN